MEGMRDSLQCPIHLDLLERAKTLPCQHVVCENCLESWVAKKGVLLCPFCMRRHDLPDGGVSNLPTNAAINNLVAAIKAEEQKVDTNAAFLVGKSGSHHDAICGATVLLLVQPCDMNRERIKRSDTDMIRVSIVTPNDGNIAAVVQKKEGHFQASFVPRVCGVYKVETSFDQQSAKVSPEVVVVHPEGRFLSGIRGQFKKPTDVVSDGYSLFVADTKSGAYLCMDWLGRQTIRVETPRSLKDSGATGLFGIAQATEKTVLVTDTVNNCGYIFKNGVYVATFGRKILNQPMGITIDKNKLIYVANKGTNDITVFNTRFTVLKNITVEGPGKIAICKPSLACLALNQAEDKLVVADRGNCCLKVISLVDSRVVRSIPTAVCKSPAKPCGVALDKDDNIYATVLFKSVQIPADHNASSTKHDDVEKGAVIMYNSEGYFLGSFGESELLNPGGICILGKPTPSVLVVDMTGSGHGSKGPGLRVFNI